MDSNPRRGGAFGALVAIAGILAVVALAYAWTAGWLGQRLTAQRLVDAIEANNPRPFPGIRRAHGKGVCVSGRFLASGDAAALSSARVFTQAEVPVTGRLSVAGADPHGADNLARVRSIALLLATDDGQQWRTAMNEFPFFPVATPEAFHALTLASRPDPATRQPDPARMAAFVEAHPELRRFQAWAGSAPWMDSWASTTFNGVNSFHLQAAGGRERAVRWSLRPETQGRALTPEERMAADGDFLEQDLRQRLASGPLRWDLVLTLAEAGDVVDDPSQEWPAGRPQVVAGTLELVSSSPQATGECRDINFDPLILPTGIAPSGDPVLLARSGAYSESFRRREGEIARGEYRP